MHRDDIPVFRDDGVPLVDLDDLPALHHEFLPVLVRVRADVIGPVVNDQRILAPLGVDARNEHRFLADSHPAAVIDLIHEGRAVLLHAQRASGEIRRSHHFPVHPEHAEDFPGQSEIVGIDRRHRVHFVGHPGNRRPSQYLPVGENRHQIVFLQVDVQQESPETAPPVAPRVDRFHQARRGLRFLLVFKFFLDIDKNAVRIFQRLDDEVRRLLEFDGDNDAVLELREKHTMNDVAVDDRLHFRRVADSRQFENDLLAVLFRPRRVFRQRRNVEHDAVMIVPLAEPHAGDRGRACGKSRRPGKKSRPAHAFGSCDDQDSAEGPLVARRISFGDQVPDLFPVVNKHVRYFLKGPFRYADLL